MSESGTPGRELIRELNDGEVRVIKMWLAEKSRLTEQIAGLQKVLATVENTVVSLGVMAAGGDGTDGAIDTNDWCLYRTTRPGDIHGEGG